MRWTFVAASPMDRKGKGIQMQMRSNWGYGLAVFLAGCGGTTDPNEGIDSRLSDLQVGSPADDSAHPPASTPPITPPFQDPEVPKDYLPVPGGFTHASCVHHIPNGSRVDENDTVQDETGKVIAHYDKCKYKPIHRAKVFAGDLASGAAALQQKKPGAPEPTFSGWVEGNRQFLPAGATTWNYYQSTMTVPRARTYYGQTDFWFGGWEPASNIQILQPVLQFGVSAAGGGGYFAFASWLVTSGGTTYVSQLKGASPGDAIQSQMYIDSTCAGSGCLNYYSGSYDFANGNYSAALFVSHNLMTIYFPAVYEAYNINSCEGSLNFTGIYQSANVNTGIFNQVNVAYSPVSCPSWPYNSCVHSGSPSCINGTYTSGNNTTLF